MSSQPQIGENIKEVRVAKGMRQQDLAESCGFSNTTLSAYENNKKTPNLNTVATIAKQLGVSIERLYYGDENNTFISAAPNTGRKIVNSVYFLWEQGVIWYNLGIKNETVYGSEDHSSDFMLQIHKYPFAISRLLTNLSEFKARRSTYKDPDAYLEMLLSSVAEEINFDIERDKKNEEERERKKPVIKKGGPVIGN